MIISFSAYEASFSGHSTGSLTPALIQEHIDQLENEVTSVVTLAREGRILQSLGLGSIQVATVIAAIGSIENFPNAGSLKSYFGWSPTVIQSGSTVDYVGQTHGGTRPMKHMMFLIVSNLINRDTEWAKLYERLVKAKCPYDERTRQRKGKLRVIGRVAGQLIETMYALLKTDAEVVGKALPNETLPEPILYDPEKHRQHREGHYQPLKVSVQRPILTLLPNSSP